MASSSQVRPGRQAGRELHVLCVLTAAAAASMCLYLLLAVGCCAFPMPLCLGPCLPAAGSNISMRDLVALVNTPELGVDVHMEVCYSCKEGGDLLCCDGCTAAFHLGCVGLEAVPEVRSAAELGAVIGWLSQAGWPRIAVCTSALCSRT